MQITFILQLQRDDLNFTSKRIYNMFTNLLFVGIDGIRH